MLTLMDFQMATGDAAKLALVATKRLLPRVGSQMLLEVAATGATVFALVARKGFDTRVAALVGAKTRGIGTPIVALLTCIWLLASVRALKMKRRGIGEVKITKTTKQHRTALT